MPEQVEETLRLGQQGRRITWLPLMVGTLLQAYHNLYRKLLREYRHFQRDDVGAGVMATIAQTFHGAKAFATLYTVTRLWQSVLNASGVDVVPLPIRWWLDAISVACPRLFDSDMEVDPILKMVLEGPLPFATSVLGHSICVCLIPVLDVDEPALVNAETYFKWIKTCITNMSEADDGVSDEEDDDLESSRLLGSYQRFLDGLRNVLKVSLIRPTGLTMGNGLILYHPFYAPGNNAEKILYVATSLSSCSMMDASLAFVAMLYELIEANAWTIVPGLTAVEQLHAHHPWPSHNVQLPPVDAIFPPGLTAQGPLRRFTWIRRGTAASAAVSRPRRCKSMISMIYRYTYKYL